MIIFPHREEILKVVTSDPRVVEVVLFGSRARGNFNPNSDIDLVVKTIEELSFREKRRMREAVDAAAGIYSVDLLFYDEMSEELKKVLEREGATIWKR